jgi:hypothetical protein
VGILGNKEADNAAKESLDENLEKNRRVPPAGFSEMDHPTTRRTKRKKMGTDRLQNEKPETTKNKEKRVQRDETKRPGSGQPITDRLFQNYSCTSHQLRTSTRIPILPLKALHRPYPMELKRDRTRKNQNEL